MVHHLHTLKVTSSQTNIVGTNRDTISPLLVEIIFSQMFIRNSVFIKITTRFFISKPVDMAYNLRTVKTRVTFTYFGKYHTLSEIIQFKLEISYT